MRETWPITLLLKIPQAGKHPKSSSPREVAYLSADCDGDMTGEGRDSRLRG